MFLTLCVAFSLPSVCVYLVKLSPLLGVLCLGVLFCFILIVIYVSCCILFHFPCIIVFDWFQLFSVTQVFSLIPDCPLCLHVTGKWFLYSAFLLYPRTRNAFYSMSNSPIHTHTFKHALHLSAFSLTFTIHASRAAQGSTSLAWRLERPRID